MELTQTAMVFAEARVGAVFLVVLSLGLAVACGLFLLRPWPPRAARAAMFVLVLCICGAVGFYALLDRRTVVDPATREITQSTRVLGIGRAAAWPFAALQVARVEYRPVNVPRQNGATRSNPAEPQLRDRFVLELVGPDTTVFLRDYDDAREAERVAAHVSRLGGWQAQRKGYVFTRGSGQAGEGISVGNLQTFEAPSGKQGLGVTLEDWTRIQVKAGAESAIETER